MLEEASPLREWTTHCTGSQRTHRYEWEKLPCGGASRALPKVCGNVTQAGTATTVLLGFTELERKKLFYGCFPDGEWQTKENYRATVPPCQFPTVISLTTKRRFLQGRCQCWEGLHLCFRPLSDEKDSNKPQGFQGERSKDLWISIRLHLGG